MRWEEKYRPRKFAEVRGQPSAVTILSGLAAKKSHKHSILLRGAVGSGKTTLVRLYAQALNCVHQDADGSPCQSCDSCADSAAYLKEHNAPLLSAEGGKIQAVIQDEGRPLDDGKIKVLFFDEAQGLSRADQQLLLKMVEEPPARVVFCFATTDAHMLSPALKSRLFEIHQDGVIRYFERYVMEAPGADLGELGQEVDRVALLYVNRSTGRFEPPSKEEISLERPSYVVRTLHKWLINPSAFVEAEFLRALKAKAERSWSDAALADDLCRATMRIVGRNRFEVSRRGIANDFERDERTLWLWSILLLTCADEGRRRASGSDSSPSHFVAGLDSLLRDYRRRLKDADPLAGKWSALVAVAKSLAPIDADRWDHGYQLFQLLLSMKPEPDAPAWIRAVRRIAAKEQAMRPAWESADTAAEYPRATLGSFSDLVGREDIVAALRKRFTDNQHERPLILAGDSQSGRRTIARLYAKALLCEGDGEHDSGPCDVCSSCSTFDSAPGFGFIEIDLGHPDALSHVSEHILALSGMPFSKRRVIILVNPESNSAALELVLKPFEDGAVLTSFVMITAEVSKIEPAILSRSQSFVLRPLDEGQTRRLSSALLPSVVDERVFQLIACASRGLPGAILSSAEMLKEASAYNLSAAKDCLGMGWGRPALDYWKAFFRQPIAGSASAELPIGVSVNDAVKHIRRVLWRLERRHCGGEGALIGLEKEFVELADQLKAAAQRAAEAGTDLSSDLGKIWCADSIVDEEQLERARLDTESMLTAFALS